jgi:hypothetical protein
MMNTTKTIRLSLKGGLLVPMALTGLAVAPHAWADNVLLAQSTMVVGTESTTDTFVAPTAGTVTLNVTGFGWAAPLSALSFSASSATQVLASWSGTGITSDTATFNVGPGSYFANIMATATPGGLDMGLYSMRLTFSPTPTVPLPSSGWLLLTGMFVLAGLARAVRPFELMGTAAA